jgi:hypothetical protein
MALQEARAAIEKCRHEGGYPCKKIEEIYGATLNFAQQQPIPVSTTAV